MAEAGQWVLKDRNNRMGGKIYRRVIYVAKPGVEYDALLRTVDTLGIAMIEIIGSNAMDGLEIRDVKFDPKGGKNTWHENRGVTLPQR